MWTASRAPSRPTSTRTGSVHSVASVGSFSRPSSMVSPQLQRRSGGYESDQSSDTATEDESIPVFPTVPSNNNMPPMWQAQRQESGSAVPRLSQKFGGSVRVADIPPPPAMHNQPSSDDDTHSRSSTLNGDDHDFDYPEKTPTLKKMHQDPRAPAPAPHVPGPLESQLASLMNKLIFMERENPTVSVTPDDYEEMAKELKALREEKKQWTKRHEAIWALRDEDVENNIKIRGMLAKARRELEGMTKLRDDDLINLQAVRSKLSEATRRLDKLEPGTGGGRASPSRGRPPSMFMERRGTVDLFAAAKAAALEQRALELEKRNGDLLSQIETLKGGASIDTLNSMTAHQAWKDTVASKDAEIARLRAAGAATNPASVGSSGSGNGIEWHRVEAIHDEHANYRESVGRKIQALRSEKEALQKELHREEDKNHMLEAKMQSLQRRVSLM